ncbi:MAG: LacI family DNA-binding transcriptional regulator [Phycisphaerae bacterium]
MSATLKEIANFAGVDISVVSRVLNDKAGKFRISQQCQDKVRKVASDLGYIPNAYAIGIKKGTFNSVAVLHSSIESRSYLPERLVFAIHRNLEQDDKHLLMAYIPEERVNAPEIPRILRSLMADGLIVNDYQYLPQKVKDAISYLSIPTVWMNYKMEYNSVYPDSFAAAKKAAEHLIGLGHKRITYCNFFFADRLPNAHYSVHERKQGYQAAMQKAGLEAWDISPDYKVDDSFEKQVEVLCSILKRPDRPTAMLFYWSTSVPPLLAAVSQLNLRIPEDLSVITFAGESSERTGLYAASMLEPETLMGKEVVAMLREKIAEKTKAIPSKKLDFNFAQMHTCAKPPKK